MRSVGIAELRSQLSRYLRDVQRGESVLVVDRETPIARLTPFEAGDDFAISPPVLAKIPVGKLEMPVCPPVHVDVVELLLADRRSR